MQIVEIAGGFKVPNDSHIGKWQIETQKLCHDEFLPYTVLPWIKPGDTVIDVGAFDGDHTIVYSDAVGSDGLVIAFEPGFLAFDCLRYNSFLFQYQNVLPQFAAVGDLDRAGKHHVNENLGASTITESKYFDGFFIRRLDGFLSDQKRVDFIKIDAEGFERKILLGATGILKKFQPTLLIEINVHALARNGTTPEEIFDYLGELGYGFFCVNLGLRSDEQQYDVLCEYVGAGTVS